MSSRLVTNSLKTSHPFPYEEGHPPRRGFLVILDYIECFGLAVRRMSAYLSIDLFFQFQFSMCRSVTLHRQFISVII